MAQRQAISAVLVMSPELKRALRNLQDPRIRRVFARALERSALAVQDEAARNQIHRSSKGPVRGPGPGTLTSRSGELRRSIRVNRAPLPFAIEAGTDLVYGASHEFGARIPVSERMRRFLHSKGIHLRATTKVVRIPARPFLQPALAKVGRRFEGFFVDELRNAVATSRPSS